MTLSSSIPTHSNPESRRYFLRTYGCQMNERDSEAVACLLEAQGLLPAASEEEADVLLYNTCSVRDQAERKVLGKLGLLKKLAQRKPGLVIAVFGCMAQRLGQELAAAFPHVQLVVGTDQIHRLPELLRAPAAAAPQRVAVDRGVDGLEFMGLHHPGRVSAYIAIMRGCDQHCTYCVVPEVRGPERSRPPADIVAETARLATDGTREVFLLGQNVTAYGLAEARRQPGYDRNASPFGDLLRAVAAVPGIARVRFTSPHPRHMNAAFVAAVAETPQICDSFHIPMQSGADRILELMHRGYTAAEYLDRIAALRQARPAATFSTDIIVGFPGETEAEFALTRAAMDTAGFDHAFIFRYSPRPGTRAAAMTDDVPDDVKMARLKLLLDDLKKRAERHNRAYVGRSVEVLVEGVSARNAERWCGRTSCNKVGVFTPPPGCQPGTLLTLRISRTTAQTLFGVAESAGSP
jgi:tRNA-2-methylthio-N6-dimethylallyladenosine synthase